MSVSTRRGLVRADATRATVIAGALIALCSLVALAIGVTAGNCRTWLAIPVLCQSSVGVAAAIAIAALPLVVFALAGRSLAALLALYIVLVPLDDALLVGPALSVTKLVGIAVGVAALFAIAKHRARVRLPYAVFGWTAVVGLMILSTIWGIDPGASAEGLVTILSAFALFVIVVATPIEPADFRAIIAATIASGAIVGVVALVMAQHELSTVQGQVGRLFLTFGTSTADPNRFGASLLLPVAMTVGAIGQARGWHRIGLLAILPLPLAAIYLTASRGTTLALIAMAIVAIFASRHRVALSAALCTVVGLLLIIPNEITSRFFAEGTEVSGAGRLDVWTIAGAVFRSHWLVGSGVGTFASAYDRAFFSAYEPQFAGWNRAPHSLLISTATELGVVGILLMALALLLQYRALRLIGPENPYFWLRTVFSAAFIGLLLAALFVDVLTTKFAWLLFTEMLLVVGLAVRPSALSQRE